MEGKKTEKEWKREIICYNEAFVSALISSFGGIEKSNQFLPDILCQSIILNEGLIPLLDYHE